MANLTAVPLRDLSSEEREIIETLGDAWSDFVRLSEQIPVGHPDDLDEFKAAIHQAQRVVLTRPAFMALRDAAVEAPGPSEDMAR